MSQPAAAVIEGLGPKPHTIHFLDLPPATGGDAKFWLGAAHASLGQAYNIGALSDGIIKHAGGVPSIAVPGVDFPSLATVLLNTNHRLGGGSDHSAVLLKALADAKGDLLVATAADVFARLPVGTNGYVLTADSGETGGMKWAAVTVPGHPDMFFEADYANLAAAIAAANSNGGGRVFASAGTKAPFTLSTAGVEVIGIPGQTIIDGGTTSTAVVLNADYTFVRNLIARTTGGNGNAYSGIQVNDTYKYWGIFNCIVDDADYKGILIYGDYGYVFECYVEGVDEEPMYVHNNSWYIHVDGGLYGNTSGAADSMYLDGLLNRYTGMIVGTGTSRSIRLAASSVNNTVAANRAGTILNSGTGNIVGHN